MKIYYKNLPKFITAPLIESLRKNLWLDDEDEFIEHEMDDVVLSDDGYYIDFDKFEENKVADKSIYLVELPFPGKHVCAQFGKILLVSPFRLGENRDCLANFLYILNLFKLEADTSSTYQLEAAFNLKEGCCSIHKVNACMSCECFRLYITCLIRNDQRKLFVFCSLNVLAAIKIYFSQFDSLDIKSLAISFGLDIALECPNTDREWLEKQTETVYEKIEHNINVYKKSLPGANPCFPIILPLRRHNSWTPFQPGSDDDKTGGGYFISTGETSLLIDPGISVVDTLYKDHGVSIADVDAIIVTHDHPDHHAELLRIFSLWYAFYGKNGKKIKIYLNLSSYNLYRQLCIYYSAMIDGGNAIVLEGNDEITIGQINIKTLPMYHAEILDTVNIIDRKNMNIAPGKSSCALGILLSFCACDREWRIGLPGDTSFPNDIDEIEKIINFFKESQIICLHLGCIEKDWLKPNIKPSTVSYGDKKHLGVVGTIKMIDLLKPQVVIVTEFGYELDSAHIKLALIDIIKRLLTFEEVIVAPSDSHLYIALIGGDIYFKCKCGGFVDIKRINFSQELDQNIVYHYSQGCLSGLDHI